MNERSVFLAALEIVNQTERAAYVNQTCAADPAARRRVEELLAAHERSGSFMDQPAAGAATADYGPIAERPGTVIGPYKLMEQIGEGGMGLVFVAEQQHPVRRKVALKIIKPGMDSRQVIARFEAERQALAMMDHQNIAKVHDAGTTESGRPYFVMELVHGIPITDYCDANQLTTRQRLELFVPVCQAIQHAHQKGIIHRDIKPSNILVTMYDDKPVPKVIDFGVAKAIEQRLTEKTVYTQFGTLVGTFEYMSPEQAEMNAFGVDTRSDVYALGVLLYELLTGTTPLERPRLREAAFGEIVRLIREEEPPRPSLRLSTSGTLAKVAAARKTDPTKLSRLVRGELDWVVMRCLEKDRIRRYESASGLARDVERYLRDEPVDACPPSAGYRLRKLARRHKVALTTMALVAATLLLGTVVSIGQAVRAARAEMDARTAEHEATKERDRAEGEKQNAEAALHFLLADVLEQADPFRDPDRKLTLRSVLDRAAKRLKEGKEMPPLVEAAIRLTLGRVYWSLGELQEGERHLTRAYDLQQRHTGPDDLATLDAAYHLARLYWSQTDFSKAEELFLLVLNARRIRLGEEDPETLRAMDGLGSVYLFSGWAEKAKPLFTKALDASRRVLGEQDSDTLRLMRGLGDTYHQLGRFTEAEPLLVKAVDGFRVVLSDIHPDTLVAKSILAVFYVDVNRLADAEQWAGETYLARQAVLGNLHPLTLTSQGILATVYLAQGRSGEAEPLLREFYEQASRQRDRLPPFAINRILHLGFALLRQQDFIRAESFSRLYLEVAPKKLPGTWLRIAKAALGASLLGQKKYVEAEALLLEGNAGLEEQTRTSAYTPLVVRQYQAFTVECLVQLYDGLKKPGEAAKWRKALEGAKTATNSNGPSAQDGRNATSQIPVGEQSAAKPVSTDLVMAIRNGHKDAISRLLDSGADVDARDAEGNTPLILASLYAGSDCVELLLKRGADANAANKAGATALIRAATNYEKTRLLVAAGAKVEARTDIGNTPLILAARRAGNSRSVNLLLEHGADAKGRNEAGISSLMAAAAGGDLETVKLLLDAGADVNDYPKTNGTIAAERAAGWRTPLMWAAFRNDVPMTRLLLDRGADPNQSSYYGNPLSQACWSNSFEAAELVIARGANVNAVDGRAGFVPLHWAGGTESPRPQLVKLLLANGADPNAAGGEPIGAFGLVPHTPRLIAEKRGRTAIVNALIAAGAKVSPPAEKVAAPKRTLPEKLDHTALIASAERALAALQQTASTSRESFLKHATKQDCVSCHQQYLPMAAVGHARNRSVRFDQDAAREQIDLVANLRSQNFQGEFMVQSVFHPDPAHTFGYALFGLVAEKVSPSAVTDVRIHHLVTIQAADGRWVNNLPRPPMQSSDFSATALAIHAIKHYGWPGRKEEFSASIERGRQ